MKKSIYEMAVIRTAIKHNEEYGHLLTKPWWIPNFVFVWAVKKLAKDL